MRAESGDASRLRERQRAWRAPIASRPTGYLTGMADPGIVAIGPGVLLKDRYRIERLLGRGGMASVWLASDQVLERQVAVKVLSDSIASDPEFLARFRREARVAAGIWHPNLIGVYDYADAAERPYLVLEYVSGPNLAERMKQNVRIDCERLARELLGAAGHIHAAGIVHRDIKAQNVLLAPDGSARLIDFGIALPADATALTRTGQLIGTARYLAPEVMRGEPASPRSDLFSCGIVLRDCLGEAPPTQLRALVERLTSAEPARRPASAAAALAALDRKALHVEEPTERLRALPPLQPVKPHHWNRRWGRVAAALVAVAVLAVALVAALGGDKAGEGTREGAKASAAERREAKAGNPLAAAPDKRATGGEAGAAGSAEEEGTQSPSAAAPEATAPAVEDPETGAALNRRGFEMIQAGRYEEAVPVLQQAVDSFPEGSEELDYAYALFNLGNALRLSDRPEEAIPVLERRLEIPNQTAEVESELAAAESEAG